MNEKKIDLPFVVRSYFFVIVLLLVMTAIMALLLSLITTLDVHPASQIAHENLIVTLEASSHGFLDLLELIIGGIIGSLAATLQFSMRRPDQPAHHGKATVHKLAESLAEPTTEKAPSARVIEQPVIVNNALPPVNPRTVVRTYLGVILILSLGVMVFILFASFTAINISPDRFAGNKENIVITVLATFDENVNGLIGLIEVAVGGVIGALGATLNYVMAQANQPQ
ncbi:MAG TPA: hypothetical protein VHL11_16690 [Phototrophicaceae bacterium]|jgi:hypothetical protein|nr:hypothetical protein [Phototrophicaceae bacterium]